MDKRLLNFGNSSKDGNDVSRRQFNRLALGLGASAAFPLGANGKKCLTGQRKDSPNDKSPSELITPAARRAIDKGLAYLLNSQVKTGRNRGAFGIVPMIVIRVI